LEGVNRYDNLHFHVYNETSGEAQYDPDQYYNYLLWFHRYNMFIKDKYQESLAQLSNDRIHENLKHYIRQENYTNDAVEEWNEHQLQHVRPYLSKYGINNTEVMFNEQLDEFAPIINSMDLIDHSKLKEQYGSEEFDQLLFTIRFKTLWMAQNFSWLMEQNHQFQLILSEELASTKLKGTYDMVSPETFDEFMLIGTSTDDLIEKLREEVENRGTYGFSYSDVNSYGYDLMRNGELDEALTVFELNTRLYPDVWNTYDSYGEGLLEAGDTLNAVKAYAKSLELNPNNGTAIEVLREYKN